MKKTILPISMFVLAVLVLVPLASADTINLSLASPIQSGVAGDTLSFAGTVTAVSDKLGPVYLSDYSAGTTPVSSLVIDGTPFLVNFPFSMSAGDTTTDTLFTVFLPATLTPGVYSGFFTILGGLDPSATSVLATSDFTINATATSPVPEPSAYVLMATGLGALMLAGFVRRRSALDDAASSGFDM